jgi:hypothetical protein
MYILYSYLANVNNEVKNGEILLKKAKWAISTTKVTTSSSKASGCHPAEVSRAIATS